MPELAAEPTSTRVLVAVRTGSVVWPLGTRKKPTPQMVCSDHADRRTAPGSQPRLLAMLAASDDVSRDPPLLTDNYRSGVLNRSAKRKCPNNGSDFANR